MLHNALRSMLFRECGWLSFVFGCVRNFPGVTKLSCTTWCGRWSAEHASPISKTALVASVTGAVFVSADEQATKPTRDRLAEELRLFNLLTRWPTWREAACFKLRPPC